MICSFWKIGSVMSWKMPHSTECGSMVKMLVLRMLRW